MVTGELYKVMGEYPLSPNMTSKFCLRVMGNSWRISRSLMHPNISMQVLHTFVYTFSMALEGEFV